MRNTARKSTDTFQPLAVRSLVLHLTALRDIRNDIEDGSCSGGVIRNNCCADMDPDVPFGVGLMFLILLPIHP